MLHGNNHGFVALQMYQEHLRRTSQMGAPPRHPAAAGGNSTTAGGVGGAGGAGGTGPGGPPGRSGPGPGGPGTSTTPAATGAGVNPLDPYDHLVRTNPPLRAPHHSATPTTTITTASATTTQHVRLCRGNSYLHGGSKHLNITQVIFARTALFPIGIHQK